MDIKYDRHDLYVAYAKGREDVEDHKFHTPKEVEMIVILENLDIPLSGQEELLAKKEVLEDLK